MTKEYDFSPDAERSTDTGSLRASLAFSNEYLSTISGAVSINQHQRDGERSPVGTTKGTTDGDAKEANGAIDENGGGDGGLYDDPNEARHTDEYNKRPDKNGFEPNDKDRDGVVTDQERLDSEGKFGKDSKNYGSKDVEVKTKEEQIRELDFDTKELWNQHIKPHPNPSAETGTHV